MVHGHVEMIITHSVPQRYMQLLWDIACQAGHPFADLRTGLLVLFVDHSPTDVGSPVVGSINDSGQHEIPHAQSHMLKLAVPCLLLTRLTGVGHVLTSLLLLRRFINVGFVILLCAIVILEPIPSEPIASVPSYARRPPDRLVWA